MYYPNMYSNQYFNNVLSYDDRMMYYFYPHMQTVPFHMKDAGRQPFVLNIHEAANRNKNFRTAIWTGEHLQVTLMSINVGEDIGLEVHPNTDQFLRIEEGQGIVRMGNDSHHLNFERRVGKGDAIMVPAGTWHNVLNAGTVPLKLYSIYAPPQHPHGTVHRTKQEAMASHYHH